MKLGEFAVEVSTPQDLPATAKELLVTREMHRVMYDTFGPEFARASIKFFPEAGASWERYVEEREQESRTGAN